MVQILILAEKKTKCEINIGKKNYYSLKIGNIVMDSASLLEKALREKSLVIKRVKY